jgi:hypothetical protein
MPRDNSLAPWIEHEQVPPGDGELGVVVGWVFLRCQHSVILFPALPTIVVATIYLLIALFPALPTIVVATIYLLIAPLKFTAHTGLILDRRRERFFQRQSILVDAPTDMTWVGSQLKVVQSAPNGDQEASLNRASGWVGGIVFGVEADWAGGGWTDLI